MEKLERTNYCGELTLADVNKEVSVVGWVSKKRNLGSLVFIDLRDRTGIVQILVQTDKIKLCEVRNEYILQIKGVVSKKDVPNVNLKTGEIEIIATDVKLINTAEQPPIIISDDTDASEDVRLKYRYLDLRRPIVLSRFLVRSKIVDITTKYFSENGFIYVETPYLSPSTPEGARDYLVPSRVHKGSFYALPQSPQLYKQMLMVGGLEKYYQIARCFRDEDLRADRQPDFTQIDIETSFLNQDQIIEFSEGFLKVLFKEIVGYDVKLPLRQMDYDYAVDNYGSDKPDTRFDMMIKDCKSIFSNSAFNGFKEAKYVKAILAKGIAEHCSRKKQDEYNLLAHKFNLKGYACLKMINGKLEGSLVKFFSEEEINSLITLMNAQNNDVIFIASSQIRRDINFGLGALRSYLAKELNLVKDGTYDLLWITHFPLFEKSEEDGSITPCHHPFTRPCDEDLPKLKEKPYEVYAYAYDIVINGYEAGGGSLRIYDQNVQKQIFEILGLSDEDIKRKFGWFVEALKYGTPPHGGLAFGLDRLAMILSGTDNIRDVIAFPKNLNATCPVTNAPYEVDDEQLKILGIKLDKGE